MTLHRRKLLALSGAALLAPHAFSQAPGSIYPTGGKGGRIIRVTTLKADGPGSITEAVKAKDPRIIVFEVGGVIDLNRTTLRISSGDVTIAGQTAPSPGITLIRGGIEISQSTRNVAITHIAVRPGEAGTAKKSGWECDGIYAYGASDILVRNCSITWATDEGLSASGKRFGKDDKAATLEEWRAFTSHDIFFLNNIVAEGLSNSTHSKGEHSKGTLIHDNVRNVVVVDSLYAHNMERNVLFKGGTQGIVRRNVMYNGGRRFTHYNLHKDEWGPHAWQTGRMEVSENAYLAGPSTDPGAAAFMLGGEGDLELDMHDNYAFRPVGVAMPQFALFGSKTAKLVDVRGESARTNSRDAAISARRLTGLVLKDCGARPWDRDSIDARIVSDVRDGTGKIIDSEQDVGGYPVRPETSAPFVEADWDLDTMERRRR